MHLGRIRLILAQLGQRLWVTPAAFALGTVGILVLAPMLEPLVPAGLERLITVSAVQDILRILGSSMLAVAIFSVGTMVQALATAASAGSPRARPLITADRTARTAISTFIGGFVFAILALVGLSGGGLDGPARVVIFAFTALVIGVVIVTLIAWIDRLSRLGGVAETVDLVAQAAADAFAALGRDPFLGARPADAAPPTPHAIRPERAGFVQMIDGARLAEAAREADADLRLLVLPGAYVDPARPVLASTRPLGDAARRKALSALAIGPRRAFACDPRYGLIVLSEIASRALSPAVNDPGTAIEVIGAAERLIADWRAASPAPAGEARARVFVPAVDPADVLDDAFRWIGRDGAGQAEVLGRLLKALARLGAADPAALDAPCRRLAGQVLARAARAMDDPDDLARLAALARRLGFQSAAPPA